jgi:hypothetical protein
MTDDEDDEDRENLVNIQVHKPLKETFEQRMRSIIGDTREFLNGLEYQIQFRDTRMLEVIEREGARFLRLVDDCLAIEKRENINRGERTRTWDAARANAMYYRSRPRRSEVGT